MHSTKMEEKNLLQILMRQSFNMELRVFVLFVANTVIFLNRDIIVITYSNL